MIEEEHFGYIGNKEISKYILKNKQQTRVGILNLEGKIWLLILTHLMSM